MSFTCESWLRVARPHLDSRLVDKHADIRLRQLARRLPPTCLTALEARLEDGSPQVDLSVRLTERDQALWLAEMLAPSQMASFLAEWEDLRDPEGNPLPAVWLEFDLEPREQPGFPSPVPCVKIPEEFPVDSRWLADSVLPAIHFRPLTAEQRRLVLHCCSELPPGTKLFYAFSLRPRGGQAIRLELYGIEPETMVEYLGKVADPELARRIGSLVPLVEGCDRYHLSFDIEETVLPRIGIECSFRKLPHREPGWQSLFTRLARRGLCTPDKQSAVFAWPGYESRRDCPGLWPAEETRGHCIRSLSHVKIVSLPDKEPRAKAYLLFGHRIRKLQDGLTRR